MSCNEEYDLVVINMWAGLDDFGSNYSPVSTPLSMRGMLVVILCVVLLCIIGYGYFVARPVYQLAFKFEIVLSLSRTQKELERPQPWELLEVNELDLYNWCYLITACGLLGWTFFQLGVNTNKMVYDFGSEKDTVELLRISGFQKAVAMRFDNSEKMKVYLRKRIPPGKSGKFAVGYHPNGTGQPGHMVAMNAWKNPDYTLGARKVDFQLRRQQRFPCCGIDNNFSPHGPIYLIDLYAGFD